MHNLANHIELSACKFGTVTVEKAKLAHGAKSICREVRVLLESLRELVASVDAQRVGISSARWQVGEETLDSRILPSPINPVRNIQL